MKKSATLAAGLMLGLAGIGYAAGKGGLEIDVDSARNAAIRYASTSPADGRMGSIDGGADVSKGLSAMNGTVKLSVNDQKTVADSQALFYTDFGSTNEAVGSMDLALHLDKDRPSLQSLDFDFQGSLAGDQSGANGTLALGATAPQPMPPFAVNATAKGTSKSLDSDLSATVDLRDAAKQVPFEDLKVDVTEVQNVTTLAVAIRCKSTAPLAPGLRQAGKNPEQVKSIVTQTLGSTGIQVQKVELTEFKDGPDGVAGKLTIALKDWRSLARIGATVYMSRLQMQVDKDQAAEAIGEMLDSQFDNFSLKLKMDKSVMSIGVTTKIEKVTRLMLGYEDLLSAIFAQQLKNGADLSPAARVRLAWQEVNIEEARKLIKVFDDAGVGIDMKGHLGIVPGTADAKGPKNVNPFAVNGDLTMSMDHMHAFEARAKAEHMTVPEKAGHKIAVHLTPAGRLGGTVYLFSDANFLEVYRQLIARVAEKAGAAPETVKLIQDVVIKGGQATGKLEKGEVTLSGYSEASNVGPAISAAARGLLPGLTGDITGFHFSSKLDGSTNKTESVVDLSKFMPGKSAADIQALFPGDTLVKDKATPAETQLVAVTKPEIAMPAALNAVAEDGRKLTGGAGLAGPGGIKNKELLLAAGGGLVLLLAFMAVAAGRKKT